MSEQTQTWRTQNVVTDEQLAVVVYADNLRSLVASRLGQHPEDHDVDDVLQETFLSARKGLKNFDGRSLPAWITDIAKKRVIDHFRAVERQRNAQQHLELDSTSRVQNSVSMVAEDFTERIDDQFAAVAQLGDLIEHVELFLKNPVKCARALELITTFADHESEASRAMGVSQDALRSDRREFVRCAMVIVRARTLRDTLDGNMPTTRELAACMPGAGNDREAGEWVATFVDAVLACGGFQKPDLAHIGTKTGLSYNTVRQYMKEAQRLMQIAYTVVSDGS